MVEKLPFSSTSHNIHNKIAILGGICWDNRYASTSTAGFHFAIPTSRQVQKNPSKTSFTSNDGQIIYVETKSPWQWLWRGMWGTAPQSIGYRSGLRANAPAPLCRPRARLGVGLKVGGTWNDLKLDKHGTSKWETWGFKTCFFLDSNFETTQTWMCPTPTQHRKWKAGQPKLAQL